MTIKSRITKLEKTTLATVEKNARAADAWLWAQFSDIELEGIILGDPDVMAKFENLNGHAITNKATSFFTQAEIAEMEELAAETCRRRLELCRDLTKELACWPRPVMQILNPFFKETI